MITTGKTTRSKRKRTPANPPSVTPVGHPGLVELPPDAIKVGDRVRKALGDLGPLKDSLKDLALLHPIIVNSRHELIIGERRLEAARQLGWKTVLVRVLERFDDLAAALRAERDENLCRLELTLSEKVALGEKLEVVAREEARKRQAAAGPAEGRGKKATAPTGSGFLPEPVTGQVRDQVGEIVGMSGKTYEKAKAVVEAAKKNPRRFGPLRDQMDRTGKVDAIYRQIVRLDAEVDHDDLGLGGAERARRREEAQAAAAAADYRRHADLIVRLAEEEFDAGATVAAMGDELAARYEAALATLASRLEAVRLGARPAGLHRVGQHPGRRRCPVTTRPESTDQGRGLLRAICEEPWVVAHRLIYADWLEENGHDIRATYIRRAIAYRPGRPPHEATTRDLADEESVELEALEDEHWQHWAWPLAELCEGSSVGYLFSRGLISHVVMTPGAFVSNAPALFRVLPITSVRLVTSGLNAVGDDYTDQLSDAGLTRRGRPTQRVPGQVFPYLAEVGLPCQVRGAEARFPGPEPPPGWGPRLVSRAAVAYGRDKAGLPPLTPEQFQDE
jgi:ParB family chromosome partitioning protein